MINLKINGMNVTAKEGVTVLEAARSAGIKIPTLCYLKDINEIGACRLCVVEVKGAERLCAACNTVVAEGMEVLTNSPRVIAARRTNLALILSKHDSHCTTCVRSGTCLLQDLSREFNMGKIPFAQSESDLPWDETLPLIRTQSKCVQCMRCVNVCDKIQAMKVWALIGTGSRSKVWVRGGKKFAETACAFCGQCITHCPTGALKARDDTMKVIEALADPEKTVIFQVAPAVRSAWAENLDLSPELATEKRMVAALRAVGADYVFDTNFTADLTIMEEANELLAKMLGKDEFVRPMFTSCCPGWVRFMKLKYPEYVKQLSSAKSPQQMFGAVAKTYFAEKAGIDPSKIYCVSVMPCVAKKYECDVPEVNDSGAGKDVDASITTREAARLINMMGINVSALPEEEFDSPLGTGTGAAVIFGATGGVMEAALRTAYFALEGKNPDPDTFKAIRYENGIREVTATLGGKTVKAAVASGLGNADIIMKKVAAGECDYDFVEIMACPGGCAGGGGQPIAEGREPAGERGLKLYALDKANTLRFSHENPEVNELYASFLEKPLSHKAHELLHTDQTKWDI